VATKWANSPKILSGEKLPNKNKEDEAQMPIDEILGREKKKKTPPDDYKCLLGPCTKTAWDVLHDRIDVSLPGKFNTKARFVQCEDCGLVDCLIRETAKDKFPTKTKCPHCGGLQVRIFN